MVDVVPLRHKRNTARGIVVHEGKLILVERWRPGLHYFSIPGGGIEAGESPEETVLREIEEETTVKIKVERQVLEMQDGAFSHRIYLCHYINGEPHLPATAPEAKHPALSNRFKPAWVPIRELPQLPFTYWKPLQQPLIDGLQNGFGPEVIIVKAEGTS